MIDPFRIARPLLHALDPESAHELTLRALELGLVPGQPRGDDPILQTMLFGRRLPNPIGLAAGFDKNARVFARMFDHGFGFVEVGGITPLPQVGNPRPRVYRLPEDGAIINRMGFPNAGADIAAARLGATAAPGLVGINLASNSESVEPLADFVALVRRFGPLGGYLTLDISCPNTANGQVFLEPGALTDLLAAVSTANRAETPLVAKLSPDIAPEALERIIDVLLGGGIDGIIVANTTSARPPLHGDGTPPGGLSGTPLFAASTALLRRVAEQVGGAVPLIGVGGIGSAVDAYAKIRAGASALQLYTALVYGGTTLVTSMKRDLGETLRRDGFASLGDAIGADLRAATP